MKNVLKRCPNKSLFQFFLGCAILNSPHNHIFSSGDGKITWQRVFSLFTYTHHRGRDCVATMGDTLIARVSLFIGAHSFYISGWLEESTVADRKAGGDIAGIVAAVAGIISAVTPIVNDAMEKRNWFLYLRSMIKASLLRWSRPRNYWPITA